MALDKSVGTQSLAMDSKKEEYKGKKLRVAIVGCGGIAQTHMEAYKGIPEVEIVAGVDILQERLDVMESKWGLPKKALFKDWKVMLKKIKPDAVDVCTPNGVHAPAVIDALNAGCHAITEKPMGMNVKECEEMVKVAKKNKRKLSVGFQQRYHNNTEFLLRARDEGQFGNIMFVKCRALRRRGIPNWGVAAGRRTDDRYRGASDRSGALLHGIAEAGGGVGKYLDLHRRQALRSGFHVAELGLENLYGRGSCNRTDPFCKRRDHADRILLLRSHQGGCLELHIHGRQGRRFVVPG